MTNLAIPQISQNFESILVNKCPPSGGKKALKTPNKHFYSMRRGGQDDKRENKLLCPHKAFPLTPL